MRRSVLTVGLLATALLFPSVSARADTSAEVSALACADNGNVWTVPAGSTVVVKTGFAAYTRGVLINFLHAQTTTFTINGVLVEGTDLFEPVHFSDGLWVSFARYSTGITLNTGESLTWSTVTTLSRLALDVFPPGKTGGGPPQPALYLAGSSFTFDDCTVTGST